MALLPIRFAVLNHLYQVPEGNVEDIMEALRSTYGHEGQFKKKRFIDHVMSLEANGLIDTVGYELDDLGELSIRYKINDEGIHHIKKYLPK